MLKRTDDDSRRLAFKSKRQHRYVDLDNIMYIESDKHAIRIHLTDGSDIETSGKLGEIETAIDDKDSFLRCHQSYLVNMKYIRDVKDAFVMSDGTTVPIRVRGRKNVTEQYFAYFNERSK